MNGKLGISIFIGLGHTLAENAAYLAVARGYGYERLFTSLHIPEADPAAFWQEGAELLQMARQLGFEITADISPRTWRYLNVAPEDLKHLGISALRADWGFSQPQLCDLLQRSGLNLEINASVVDESVLSELLASGISRDQLSAGHNYYPRPETGLSYSLFSSRSSQIASQTIPVSAFIPSKTNPRGPVFAGLPTLESHRTMSAVDAARQLWASGHVSSLRFGDPLAAETELRSVAALSTAMPAVLELRMEAICPPEYGTAALQAVCHTNRLDAASQVVRSQESRNMNIGGVLPQASSQRRARGDITIDNDRYGRYAGELQIVLTDLPADPRVNVVARIVEQDLCLLDCLEAGRKFRLKEAD